MTLQNQRPPYAQESIFPSSLRPPALPAVEWTPLDELIQSWATFAHATTNPVGLSAASAAFAALAAKTTARHVAVFADGLGASRLPDSVYVDLDEACDHWLLALGHLGHLSSEGEEPDEAVQMLADLGRLSVQHQQSLFALSARLWQEIVLEQHCTTSSTVKPAIGTETSTARLTLHMICTAFSYSRSLALRQISRAAMQYGQLSAIQFSVVSMTRRQAQILLHVYVTAQVRPVLHLAMH